MRIYIAPTIMLFQLGLAFIIICMKTITSDNDHNLWKIEGSIDLFFLVIFRILAVKKAEKGRIKIHKENKFVTIIISNIRIGFVY